VNDKKPEGNRFDNLPDWNPRHPDLTWKPEADVNETLKKLGLSDAEIERNKSIARHQMIGGKR
jgi:hypothetical protein